MSKSSASVSRNRGATRKERSTTTMVWLRSTGTRAMSAGPADDGSPCHSSSWPIIAATERLAPSSAPPLASTRICSVLVMLHGLKTRFALSKDCLFWAAPSSAALLCRVCSTRAAKPSLTSSKPISENFSFECASSRCGTGGAGLAAQPEATATSKAVSAAGLMRPPRFFAGRLWFSVRPCSPNDASGAR
jgi:hypothetical protein